LAIKKDLKKELPENVTQKDKDIMTEWWRVHRRMKLTRMTVQELMDTFNGLEEEERASIEVEEYLRDIYGQVPGEKRG
jgi:hypothetical protein